VREVWQGPLGVALPASDRARGGIPEQEALAIARAFREAGCDFVEVRAGQTVPDEEPTYGRGYLAPYAEAVRLEVGAPVRVGGGLTLTEAHALVASGRADLCVLDLEGDGFVDKSPPSSFPG
jgi:anthraniloyl-CoA monooxygenase